MRRLSARVLNHSAAIQRDV